MKLVLFLVKIVVISMFSVPSVSASWGANPEARLAAVENNGGNMLAFTCDEDMRAILLFTDRLIPTIGSGRDRRHVGEWSTNRDGQRPLLVFFRNADTDDSLFVYELVFYTRGNDSTFDDALGVIKTRRQLHLDIWRGEITFSLKDSRAAIERVERRC